MDCALLHTHSCTKILPVKFQLRSFTVRIWTLFLNGGGGRSKQDQNVFQRPGSVLLLPGGEGRDEGGRNTDFAPL
jgi:hypothetical protein